MDFKDSLAIRGLVVFEISQKSDEEDLSSSSLASSGGSELGVKLSLQ